MTIRELINALDKIENKDALVGFTLWHNDRSNTYFDGRSPRDLTVHKDNATGLEVVSVGRADLCRGHRVD